MVTKFALKDGKHGEELKVTGCELTLKDFGLFPLWCLCCSCCCSLCYTVVFFALAMYLLCVSPLFSPLLLGSCAVYNADGCADIQVDSNVDWLYSFLIDVLHDEAVGQIESQVCSSILGREFEL